MWEVEAGAAEGDMADIVLCVHFEPLDLWPYEIQLMTRFLSSEMAESLREGDEDARPTIRVMEKREVRANVRGEVFEERSPFAYFSTVLASSRLLRRAERK